MSKYLSRSSRCCSRREYTSLVHCWSVESFLRSVLLFWHCTALTGPTVLHGTDRAWEKSAKRKERPLRSTRESRLSGHSLRGATLRAGVGGRRTRGREKHDRIRQRRMISPRMRERESERGERETAESDEEEWSNCAREIFAKRERIKKLST